MNNAEAMYYLKKLKADVLKEVISKNVRLDILNMESNLTKLLMLSDDVDGFMYDLNRLIGASSLALKGDIQDYPNMIFAIMFRNIILRNNV